MMVFIHNKLFDQKDWQKMTTAALPFLGTSVGKKVVMALSGVILFGFVTGHMLGNLQLFLGPARLNAYAAMLQGMGPALWVVRLFMLLAVLIHIYTATLLTLQSWAARPDRYARHPHHDAPDRRCPDRRRCPQIGRSWACRAEGRKGRSRHPGHSGPSRSPGCGWGQG